MSEENRNDEGMNPMANEGNEAASSEALSADSSAVLEEEVSESAAEDNLEAASAEAEFDANANDASEAEMASECESGALTESASDSEPSAEETPAEILEPDLSTMSYEDRVSYYQNLETAKGYIKALRLVDFHEPGEIRLAEVWGSALNAHSEMAREIFEGAYRYVTSSAEVWSNVLEAHNAALENASDEGQAQIGEIIGLIQCLRTREPELGRERLTGVESAKGLLELLDVVSTGNWRKVEQTAETQIRARLSDDAAVQAELAHAVADLALSTGALDRAVEIIRRTSRKVTDDVGLKWRLAILSRDQKKWNGYVDVLNKELIETADSVEEKADIYNEMIRIYRDETKQEAMVVKTYEALLSISPNDGDALKSLVEIYEKMRRWPDLIKILESQAEHADESQKVEYNLQIANIYLEKLSRKVNAISYFENVLAVNPEHDEAINQLKALYTERRDWEKLIDVHRKELAKLTDVSSRIALLKEMADIAKTKMRSSSIAIEMWNLVLECDPENAEAISSLESLYEGEKQWGELAKISELKISLISDEKLQFEELQKLGVLYSERAKDNVSAISTWRRVLAIDPSYAKGIDNLRKLLIEERDWASLEEYYSSTENYTDLVKLFEQLSKTLKDAQDKKAVLLRAADVYENKLSDSDSAMVSLEKILEIDPQDSEAAEKLVPYYESRERHEDLAKMLEIIFESREAGADRSSVGLRLGRLLESKLGDDSRAYGWYMKTVEEDIHFTEAYDGLDRTAGKTGHAQDVVDLFNKNLTDSDDGEFIRELKYRIGCLDLEYLDKSSEAQKIFEELLSDNPEDIRALGALENILEREGRFTELLEVNERRMGLAKTPADMAETLLSGARIHENHLNDKAGAIESYERVSELLPEDTRPLIELHRLYAETESYESLARVIEKQLSLLGADTAFSVSRSEAELNEEGIASVVYGAKLERKEDGTADWAERTLGGIDKAQAVSLWFELGEVYRSSLSEYEASAKCYDNILLVDSTHAGSVGALESLLEDGVSTELVCLALSKVYAIEENYEALQNVLVRLSEVLTLGADKLTYLVCAAQINSEILDNSDRALDCLSRAMMAEPAGELVKQMLLDSAEKTGCWERVIEILETVSHAVSSSDEPELATQYALELGSLYETQLDNRDKAIEYGTKALALGKNRQDVIDYLKETFTRLESWQHVVEVLKAERELAAEDDTRLLSIDMEIASIYENQLGSNEAAVDTLLEVLEKHSDNTDAMEHLDRLYVASERWEEAVANCERRLELEEDSAKHDEIECHLASILSEHLHESERAYDIYSNILSHDSQNAMAVSGLEQMISMGEGSIVEQISELLLPIYDVQDNWEKRAWTDEQLLRVIPEPERRRDLLHEIANLEETRGEDHEKAYDAYARSLKEDLRSEETINQLFNYADVLDKWSDLVKVMEDATKDSDDPEAARNIQGMTAEVYREHLNDIDSAIATYEAIRTAVPEDIDALNYLEELYREKESWKELSEVELSKAKLTDDPEARKELLFQAAALNEEILNDVDKAIAINNEVLADEAGEPTALDNLERLYKGKEEWSELLNVYIAKNDNAADDEARKSLYYAMGELQETKLDDLTGAIETYQNVLSIDPDDSLALESLDRLYQANKDMESLLDILQRREAISEDEDAKINFKFRQAECRFRSLEDTLGAIEVYRAVFGLDPSHEASIASVEEIIGLGGEASVEAAKTLVPIYQGLERWNALVKVYEVLVAGSDDLDEKISLLGTIGTVHEEMLNAPKDAFEAWLRALALDAARDTTWEKVESLADTCECNAELVEKLSALIPDLSGDSNAAIITAKHLAAIYEGKLNEPEKAVEAYRQVLEMDSNDADAIHGLNRLYEALEKWEDLAELLHIEIDIADSDEERLNSYYRLGAVQEMYLQKYDEAVGSYNEMLLLVPGQPEAIESLHRIFDAGQCCSAVADILEPYYRGIEDWQNLVDLDLKYVDHIEEHDDRYDKFIEIADVYLNQLAQIPEGLAIYGRALAERPGDDLCLSKIDELSDVTQDWSNNVSYYQNALNACEDDIIKQDLTLRMAQTCDAHLENYADAEKYYLEVLNYDSEHLISLEALDRIYAGQERWEELTSIIRREIPAVDSDDTRIQLYMRLGSVLNDMLGKGDDAIAAYNELLNIDPSFSDALSALEGIYQGREDWVNLCDTYEKEAAAANDDDTRVQLWGKMAQLKSEILNKPDEAVDLWYQVIDTLGDNLVSLQNLEVLFVRGERWTDMADVVERQLPFAAEDPELHLETYRKLGRVYRDKLEDDYRSIDWWKQALTVNQTDIESLRAIEALDEKVENPDDLAATLHLILQSGKLELNDQITCAVKMAGVLDGLGRVEETINTWLYVNQLDGTNVQALNELERLYTEEGQYENVIKTLHSKIDIADDLETKVDLLNQIAKLWEIQVGNIDNAAETYQSILDLDSNRNAAFDSLEELYTNHEKWQELLSAYVERAEIVGSHDQKERLNLLLKASKIAEDNLNDGDMAFCVIQSAIPENWREESLQTEVERLAEKTHKWDELVNLYEGLIENAETPTDSLALHNTVARWYFHHLNDNEASWHHFQFVLSEDPKNIAALENMSEIFYRLGNWDELVNCLGQRIDLTNDTDQRVSLFLELAKVYEEKLGDYGQAVEFYIQAFRLNEERLDVMKELARIYESTEQWKELVDMLERETAVIEEPEEKAAVRYKIGTVWEEHLSDNEKAAESYNAVLEMDESHANALSAAERTDVALERWNDLLKVYNLQLAAFYEPAQQIDIYNKMSQVYENQINNLDEAISSLVQVTLIDPANIGAFSELERLYEKAERWQDLIDILNTHINTLNNPNDHVELYRKLGEVYRDKLNDAYHSVESYQSLISIAPNDTPALYALADLYEASEDYISTIDFLNRIIAAISDTSEACDVHFRIGALYDKHLEDDTAAEERYKVCLDINAGYMPAIDALAAMYERHEDWNGLVRILKQKIEFTRELDQKAAINCKLGSVSLNKLDDTVNAYAYYNEALSLQPECTEAALPLAEKNLADKVYARALLLFEIVIRHSNYVDDNSQLYLYNYKAGCCCQNLSQHEKALEFYRASYELNQNYAPTLLGMGEELLEAKDYDRSYKMFEGLLSRFSGELTQDQLIQIYYDSALAKKSTGELALAREILERILESDGSQTKSLELIIEVCSEMADWEALVYYMNIHMERQNDNDLKFAELMKIANVFAENINDPERQIQTYYKALEVEPGSRIVLNQLLSIYNATGQWENAIDIIDRICASEEDSEKIAKYYYTIGVIYRDELNNDIKAVEYFNKTLDTSVGELRAFESIDRIFTASRDWEALERNYLAMIKRVYDDGNPSFDNTKLLLWYSLGEIYRTRLNEWDRAIEAFKKAIELSPKDIKLHTILSELYVRMPVADYGHAAIEEIRTIIDLQGKNVTFEQEKKNYRTLFYTYSLLKDYDKAWCIADITTAKQIAMDDEIDFHSRADMNVLSGTLPRLSADDIKYNLFHPTLSGDLTKLFSSFQQCMRPAFCNKDKDEGFKKSKDIKVNPEIPFWRIFTNSCTALGVTVPPRVYLSTYNNSGMRIANVDFNAFRISQDMLGGRSIEEMRFIIARNLFLFQNFFMAGISLGASALKKLITASIGFFTNTPPADENDQKIFTVIDDIDKGPQADLRLLITTLVHRNNNLNASAWLKAVDYSCDRAGLLLCANYQTAVSCIRHDEAQISKLSPEERIEELTHFAMSDEYFALRNSLNIKFYDDSDDVQ